MPQAGYGGKRPLNLSGKPRYLALNLSDVHRLGQVEANHCLHRFTIVVHLAGEAGSGSTCHRRRGEAGGGGSSSAQLRANGVNQALVTRRAFIRLQPWTSQPPTRALGGQSV